MARLKEQDNKSRCARKPKHIFEFEEGVFEFIWTILEGMGARCCARFTITERECIFVVMEKINKNVFIGELVNTKYFTTWKK